MADEPFAPLDDPALSDAAIPDRKGRLRVVQPVPDDAPTAPAVHPTLGRPSQRWAYKDAAGQLLGYVLRFDRRDGKDRRPLVLCRSAKGKLSWQWKSWDEPRPLYGLDALARHPGRAVIVAEGEKAGEAAGRLLSEQVVITSPGGSNAPAKACWKPLAGRHVTIWPDNDEPGRRYAETVAGLATTAGASAVAIIVLPDGLGEGWDAADAEAQGWTSADAQSLVEGAIPFTPDAEGDHSASGSVKPRKGNTRRRKRSNRGPNSEIDDRNQDDGNSRTSSQRCGLLEAANPALLWHSPAKEGYATIPANDHFENWPLDSEEFRKWLAYRFYRAHGAAATGQALSDALRVLESIAINEHAEFPVHQRVGWDASGDALWIDLCDGDWRSVKITRNGWEVSNTPSVKFVRTPTMAALPEPEGGSLVESLRRFVNADEDGYCLTVAWALGALSGRATAYPVLAIGGEQGSGKSNLTRLLRSLVDPSHVDACSPPKDERDLIVVAHSGHVIALDNVSNVAAWLSDGLCRIATGGGFITRKLHTDKRTSWFRGARPVILNGIPSLTERPDLAERAIVVRLSAFRETDRRSEEEFWDDWLTVRPQVLGALCDALSRYLARICTTRLDRLPRMADFAKLVAAAEPALGWEPGTFERAYGENRRQASDVNFEADPVAVAVYKFFEGRDNSIPWEGTATELLSALERASPLLRQRGVTVTKRHTSDARVITLTTA